MATRRLLVVGNTVCPLPALAAAAVVAANPHCAPRSRSPKYRSPANPKLRSGKKSVRKLAKLLQYIPLKFGFRLSSLFLRFARAALPASLADKSPGPEREYLWPVLRNIARKVSALRHPDSGSRRCDPSPSENRRAAVPASPPPALRAYAFAVPSGNTSAPAARIPVSPNTTRQERDCLRSRTPAAHATARPALAPAWISQRGAGLQ